ncbi:MAG: NifB/NifX family molybdenum-iron cluster-binding protein [Negativicutes bacterium]|jgi:predicted Fe-Mo cluster-binding NifX family protein
MRILIPTFSKETTSSINPSFGRAEFFAIFDDQTGVYTFIENPACSAEGGAGILAAQTVVDNKIDVVIATQCGQNAADVLKAANIKIAKAIPGKVFELVEKYRSGLLAELTEIHSGFHRRGGQ